MTWSVTLSFPLPRAWLRGARHNSRAAGNLRWTRLNARSHALAQSSNIKQVRSGVGLHLERSKAFCRVHSVRSSFTRTRLSFPDSFTVCVESNPPSLILSIHVPIHDLRILPSDMSENGRPSRATLVLAKVSKMLDLCMRRDIEKLAYQLQTLEQREA